MKYFPKPLVYNNNSLICNKSHTNTMNFVPYYVVYTHVLMRKHKEVKIVTL